MILMGAADAEDEFKEGVRAMGVGLDEDAGGACDFFGEVSDGPVVELIVVSDF